MAATLLSLALPALTGVAGEGRSRVDVADPLPDVEHVAMMPVKAPSDAARALFTYLLMKELRESGRYQILEPAAMKEELDLPVLALAALTDEQAVEVGNLLGVDAVVLGTVADFSSGEDGAPAVAEIGVRMLHCASGRAVWRASHRAEAASADVKLSEHAEGVTRALVAALEARLPPRPAAEAPAAEDVAPPPEVTVEVELEGEEAVQLSSPLFAATPQGFDVSQVGLREVTLVWDRPIERARHYRVERSASPRGDYEAIAEVAPRRRHYRDADRPERAMADATTYYYRLVAVRRDGVESRPTKPVRAETPPPPAPPGELGARTPDSRLVLLAWAPSEAEGVVEYVVERAPAEGAVFDEVAVVGSTSCRDSGEPGMELEDDQDYLYRVRAVNRVGSVGPPSEAILVTTPPRPAQVNNLVVEDSSVRAVPLSWTLNAETNVVEYRVFRADNEKGEFTLLKRIGGRTNTRFVDGGGIPGQLPDAATYYYMVQAVNGVGAESVPSEVVRGTTRGIPPVVRSLAAVSGQPRQVELQWEESPDDKVMGYEVWRAVGESDQFAMVGRTSRRSSTTYLDRGGTRRPDGLGLLLDGQVYRYKVLAYNVADVQSDWSEEVSARTKRAPVVPAGLEATTELPRRIGLAWPANPETDVEEYLVEIRRQAESSSRWIERVASLSESARMAFTDEGIDDGDERYYRVKAVDRDGLESEWSDRVQGQAKPAPDAPKNLYAHAEDRAMRLSWDAPAQDDIRAYRVWTKHLLAWDLLDTTEQTEYYLPASELSRRSVLCVTAVDQDGLESAQSEPVRAERVETW